MVNLLGLGYDAAERLGILPALSERDFGAFTSILVRSDGTEKFTVPAGLAEAATGNRAISVFRGDLESVLFEAVSGMVDIRFGMTVRTVDELPGEVRVALSDGTTEHADLLVGADGLHSGVRATVFSSEDDVRVDFQHLVGAFPLDTVPTEVPVGSGTTFIGPRRTAAVMNLGPGRSSCFFTYRSPAPAAELEGGALRALTGAFGDLGGGVPDALRQLEAAPEDAYFDSVSQIVMDTWHRGRVVLLGDAAWCVTLFAGYGAALALAGADRLGTALEQHGDVPSALRAWEEGLRPEISKRQGLARKGMAQFAPPNNVHIWIRDVTLRAMGLPGIRQLVLRSIQRANR